VYHNGISNQAGVKGRGIHEFHEFIVETINATANIIGERVGAQRRCALILDRKKPLSMSMKMGSGLRTPERFLREGQG